MKLYLELEALAARSQHARATSLPTIVRLALLTLARKLGIPPSLCPALLADAAARILSPRPYEDAAAAMKRLISHGCTVVGLLPVSSITVDAVWPVSLRGVRFFPVAVPLHAPAPAAFFAQLRRWCENMHSPSDSSSSGLTAADVLVVSGGMGRVLVPALADGHPTVLVRRASGVECSVDFVVGMGNRAPHPSAVFDGLAELCDMLCTA